MVKCGPSGIVPDGCSATCSVLIPHTVRSVTADLARTRRAQSTHTTPVLLKAQEPEPAEVLLKAQEEAECC